MKTIIYYRVSTKLQEDRYSLKAQKEELTRYANSQGWEIVAEFKDVDSGGKLDKEGLNALMDFVEENSVDVVLCVDQDRLSRLDTLNWEFLKDVLRDNGVKIAEPGSIVDLKNEDDEFISDLKNLIAQREKRAIVRRMMRGKRQRTREGKGWGVTPSEYLYDKSTGTYTLNEKWAWVYLFMKEAYMEKNMGDEAIAAALNKITKTPNGNSWLSSIVSYKLTSEVYCGRMIKKFANGEKIVVENVYPRLCTDEEYQKIIEKRKSKYRRRPEGEPQLLRRVDMTCAYCGKKMAIRMSGVKGQWLHFYVTHRSDCQLEAINTIRVESNLIKALKDIVKEESLAKQYIQIEYGPDDLQQIENEINMLRKLMGDAKAKIDRLLPLYLDGKWSKELLNSQKTLLENELELHEQRHNQLANKQDLIKSNLFNYDIVMQYLGVAERFDTLLEKSEQMQMIGHLFPTATVYEDKIIFNSLLPNNIPLDIRVPIAPNPYEKAKIISSGADPQGKYNRMQQYLKDNPDASVKGAADALKIPTSTAYRLEKKFGKLKSIDY
ncbi:recombinase family protein [Lysinibacillus sp. NPDC097287]|uniref:recombinase family protein n=1 Tax=Lysinibacillus sp. NPDC097287 TaxID=3364144 RepID=UPI00382246CB